MESPNYVAGGSIYPSRIVVLDNSADNAAGAALAGSLIVFEANSNASVAVSAASGTPPVDGLLDSSAAPRGMMGISMPGTDYPPINDSTHVTVGNYAAVATEDLQVYGPGQVGLLELAGTVKSGQLITCQPSPATGGGNGNDGRGVAVGNYSSAAPQFCIGRALQNGVSGEKILVLVQPQTF